MQLKNKHLRAISYFATVATLMIGITLYNTNYRVRQVQGDLTQVTAEISKLSEALHVLNAEWSYLDSPKRLKKLNDQILSLKPVKLEQLASWETVNPARDEPRIVLAYKKKQEALG